MLADFYRIMNNAITAISTTINGNTNAINAGKNTNHHDTFANALIPKSFKTIRISDKT